jgi:flavin-dependent dehydrogenase
VGADGPASRVGRAIRARNRLLPAAQVEMTWPEDDAIYAIIDRDLPSEPYSCWIFLKNERGTANVGCFGTVPTLEAFISKYRIEGEIVEKNGGAIPLGVAERLQRGRAVLNRDAEGSPTPSPAVASTRRPGPPGSPPRRSTASSGERRGRSSTRRG